MSKRDFESPYAYGCHDKVVCPKCSSQVRYFYVRESSFDSVIVDLICGKCGYSWSDCWDIEKLHKLPRPLRLHKK
jgi:hypothetical protein